MTDILTGLDQVLGYESVTQMIVMFPDLETPFADLFPVKNIDGDTAKWDVWKRGRGIALGNVSGGAANKVALQVVETKTGTCFILFDEKDLPGDLLNRLRSPGSQEKGARALLAGEALDLTNLHRRTRAYMCAKALTGTLSFTLNTGITRSVAYGIAATHTPTAAVTWAAITTDIIGDIIAWKTLIQQHAGFTPTRAYCNSGVMEYLMANTAVQKFLGTNAYMEMVGKEGMITRLAGLNIRVVDEGYMAGSTFTKYVADDAFIITPEPGDWAALQVGTVSVPSQDALTDVQAPAGYVSIGKNPPAIKLFRRDMVLPILAVPDAIICADVTT